MKNLQRRHIIIFVLFLIATVMSYFFLDIPVARWCRRLDRSILDIAEIVTEFGKSTAYLIVSFLLFVYFKFYRKKEIYANQSMFVFASVASSGIFVDLVKWIAGRYRPVMLFDLDLYGFTFFRTGYEWTSFTSGHAVTAFSLAFSLSILFPKGRFFFFPAAVAIAASRVLLASHYLGDVIFGAYIGIASVYLLKAFFDRRKWMLR